MTTVKFKPGERVKIDGRSGSLETGLFEVIRLMPDEGRGHEYRLRSETGQERISFEHVMRRAVAEPLSEAAKTRLRARTPTRNRGN